MNWQDFHFVRSEALWLLALLPPFAWLLFKRRGNSQEWSQVCDPELLPYVVEQESTGKQQRHWLWPLLLGLPAIVALAGPVWERIPQPVFDETQALVVLLDSSRSMDAEDIKPSRYERAKLKLLDLLSLRETGQTALIAYAAEPFVVSPLTHDGKTIAALVPPLKTEFMPRQGSNVVLAVEKAIELLNNAGARGNILLLSDGVAPDTIDAAANLAQQANARLSVIGIGSSDGAPIPSAQGFLKDAAGNIVIVKQDVRELRQLASDTGGIYSPLTASNKDLERTVQSATVNQALENASELESTEFQADQWREQGPWLLLPLLLIAPLLFRRGVLMIALVAPLSLGLYSPSAEAWEWRDLFRNQDQRAADHFEQQQFQQSAEQFNNPEWKASAHYRAGDYAAAVEQLQDINTPQAHYNRGNALAKMGEIDKAISAYKQTLLADKGHADAKHNLELLENQQDQEKQDPSDNSDSSEDSEPSESSDQEPSDQNQQENSEQSEQSEQAEQQDSQQQNADDPSQNQESSDPQEADQQQASESEEESKEESQSQAQQQDESAEAEEDAEQNEANYQQQFQDKTEQEVEQATQQWLRRIPDQPSNLLRNQFDNEYRRRQQRGETQNTEEQPW